MVVKEVLERLGIAATDGDWVSRSPIDGAEIGHVRLMNSSQYDAVVSNAADVFKRWRMEPAPKRGLIVRQIGDELRRVKDDLGALVMR